MNDRRERSRSEIVRGRRNQQSQKKITHSTSLTSRALPPITSRDSLPYAAPQKAVHQKNRRQFQTALSTPRIEVRLPSVSFARVEIKWRLVSLFLSLLLGTGLYLSWTLPVFSASVAQIRGNQSLPADAINAVLDTKGQSIFTLIPSQMATRLRMNYPELVSANVSLSLPDKVMVDVVERKPIILWQQTNGYTWIDDTGVAFRPQGEAINLITVAGIAAPPPGSAIGPDPFSPIPYLSLDMVNAITTLAPSMPKGTTMVYQPPYGLGWSDSRGWQAFFGNDAKNMTLNLQVYQSLVNSLSKQGIRPAFISVQYANAPYYRMSQ